MEDTLGDIKALLSDMKEQDGKALVIRAETLKHTKDASTTEPDREEVEEELRDMIVEVID